MKFFSLSFKLMLSGMASYLMGALLAVAVGATPFWVAVTGAAFLVLSLVPKGMNLKGSLGTITITDILTEYGSFYKAGSQALKDLKVKLMQSSITESYFTARLTASTKIELGNVSITRVLQAYQSGWTPIGDTTFTPQPIYLDHLKIDATILPHDLMESWLGFLVENALTPKDTPLVKFWLENLVIPKFQEDLEVSDIFHGKKAAIVPGTPSAAGASMNGIKEKLKGAGVNVITMGASPTDAVEYVEYVEDYAANIPELARTKIDGIFMNQSKGLLFKQGMRKKYNMNYAQEADLLKLADFDMKIFPLPSMNGHTSIWSTPKDNRIIANKNPGNQGVFDVQPLKREVNALTDFHKGIGFWSPALVFRSDVSLA